MRCPKCNGLIHYAVRTGYTTWKNKIHCSVCKEEFKSEDELIKDKQVRCGCCTKEFDISDNVNGWTCYMCPSCAGAGAKYGWD